MCPSGVDQTERGPQQWHILAPRRRKIQKLAPDHSGYSTSNPLECLFNDKRSWNAWSKLAVHANPPQTRTAPLQTERRAVRRSSRNNIQRTSRLSKLESLPAELLASIIEEPTLGKSDIIALGFASETLWTHVLEAVEKDCLLTQPSMAGIEIACTGTYLTDLPESFANDGLAKSSVKIWQWGSRCEARRINWAASRSYDVVDETPEEGWHAAWKAHKGLMASFPARQARKMSAEFLARCSALRASSPDALWVLRNLTTREYVRCRPGKGTIEGRGLVDCKDGSVKVRIDDVLLMRICWTRLAVWEDTQELGIFRGKWAGHCFDIVPWERLDDRDGWRDCTDEVVEQARFVAEKIRPRVTVPRLSPRKRKAKIHDAYEI
jgi:hypothetical protein